MEVVEDSNMVDQKYLHWQYSEQYPSVCSKMAPDMTYSK